jgi:hypothetical protein
MTGHPLARSSAGLRTGSACPRSSGPGANVMIIFYFSKTKGELLPFFTYNVYVCRLA